MSDETRRRWTAADIDAAAAKPSAGWNASGRRRVHPQAVQEAKALLELLDDAMPDVVDWDAWGGLWFEWKPPHRSLCVSIFSTITILVVNDGADYRSYRSTSAKESAMGIRAILGLHQSAPEKTEP